MSKNYFTDEQVVSIVLNDAGIWPDIKHEEEAVFTINANQLKAIMNLAVEAAIGEEVAYQYDTPTGVDGLSRIELSRNKLNAPKDTTITQLYSVKELEN